MMLIAMQTDVGDEAVILIRFNDRELLCNSLVRSEVQRYRYRVVWLYEHRGCLTTGYTQHMIKFLSRARTVVVDNTTIQIGSDLGCPPEAIEAALGDMMVWLNLSLATMDAEYPSFEVLQAFHIFDLVADEENADGICMSENSCATLL